MKIILILAGIIIIILLLLFYFNQSDLKYEREARKEERAMFNRKEQAYREYQGKVWIQVDSISSEYKTQLKNDSAARIRYVAEIRKWRLRASEARTPYVDSLIQADDSLKQFVAYQDTIIHKQALRLDSVEIERRIEREMQAAITAKTNSYIESLTGERDFLAATVVQRDSVIDIQDQVIEQLEQKVKKRTWLAGVLALLNLVPRGN